MTGIKNLKNAIETDKNFPKDVGLDHPTTKDLRDGGRGLVTPKQQKVSKNKLDLKP